MSHIIDKPASIINAIITGETKLRKPNKDLYQFCQNNLDGRSVHSINQIYNEHQKQLLLFILMGIIILAPLIQDAYIVNMLRFGPKIY